MNLDQAKSLTIGRTIYHVEFRNKDGTPERWKVNGKVWTWKKDPGRIRVPLKRGLYETHQMTEATCPFYMLTEEEAVADKARRRMLHLPFGIQGIQGASGA